MIKNIEKTLSDLEKMELDVSNFWYAKSWISVWDLYCIYIRYPILQKLYINHWHTYASFMCIHTILQTILCFSLLDLAKIRTEVNYLQLKSNMKDLKLYTFC